VGVLELAVTYIRERYIDRFVLLDMGLIVALGGVSIALDNDIFFRLKPALIELLFCIIIGISVFSPMNILLMMSRRYMKNIQMGPAQLAQMNRSMKALLVIFSFHVVLVVYAAFYMSKAMWGFISGGLFYILFGIYFVFEFFHSRKKGRAILEKYRDDEWFDLVDEDGRVTGRAPRTLCHSGPGMLHPVLHLHVIDSKDRIYLQKRSIHKQIQPGKWDTAVGGHVQSGEKLEDALKREADEELGISSFKAALLEKYVWETDVESELVFMLVTRYDSAITFNPEEIDEGKFWKLKKIKENLGKGILTPNFEHEFAILLKQVFKQ
jgi:isopentenyldiphosphate isomerase/intracellular septation protein A